MDLGTVVSFVFPILTVVVGGACILLYGVTTTLRATNGDLRDRVGDLESQLRNLAEKNEAQASELHALQRVVTGEVQLTAIADVLDHHHVEAVKMWGDTDKTLQKILAALVKEVTK